jgi:hypothetical protein
MNNPKGPRFAVYRAYLDRLNLPNRIDEYGDIEFLRTAPGFNNERRFNIFLVEDQPEGWPEYLSVDLHNYTEVGEGRRDWWAATIYEINANFKVVKASFEDDTIRLSCQLFVPSTEVGCEVLMACIKAIESVYPYVLDKLAHAVEQGMKARR